MNADDSQAIRLQGARSACRLPWSHLLLACGISALLWAGGFLIYLRLHG
jgi:hypothetical protein